MNADMKKLILKSFQSPGDVLMLTAAVRDLHQAHPGKFRTDVRTSAQALWENNPRITPLREGEPGVQVLDMHYPLIHQSNQRPYHFLHGYLHYLEERLGLKIPATEFRGEVFLSPQEKESPVKDLPESFWIVIAGGKYDFTAKWWNPASYQKVVDAFRGRVHFVQCGEEGHWHPRLQGVTDLVGKTTTREFVRLMYHADGVLCPVTFAMHLAAAVETKPGKPKRRAAVVIAGGREPSHWEAYPHHQFLHTQGTLDCCAEGGCWKSRCQLVGDGDGKDQCNLCLYPVQVSEKLRVPRCMEMIRTEDVVRRIELYYEGGALKYLASLDAGPPVPAVQETKPVSFTSVSFYHGLGDCANFARLIPLYLRRGHRIGVECTPDKSILFRAAGAEIVEKAEHSHPWAHSPHEVHSGQGHDWQGSKSGWNISEPPLPSIGEKAELWDEYCASEVRVLPHVPKDDIEVVKRWLADLPRPVVLLHTKGNSGQQQKSLPDAVAVGLYKELLDRFEGSFVLLDWDNRVPRLASWRVRHLADLGGPCPTERMFALMEEADLVVGVDSGPLHACGLTGTPSVGIWMPAHYAARFALPRKNQLNIVLAEPNRAWNRYRRIPWNLVEHPGDAYDAAKLAEWCASMLRPSRYLPADCRAADVQMQQWVLDWCRNKTGGSLSGHVDRSHSFDVLFRELRARFERPTIVETGTIRAEDDWPGAGFFTYLAGAYVFRSGGVLHSVDLDPANCRFAQTWCAPFGNSVHVHTGDSVAYLRGFGGPIDLLYLDSLDTYEPGHAEHAMRELEAAMPWLHEKSLIVFDDTPWHVCAFTGKGARAVPWLLQQGWNVLYAGYQVVLSRSKP